MAISVFSAAKYLVKKAEEAGKPLTNLQVQKILYLAQMAYMAEHKGEPLIDSYFEAWDYGPVCPPLYRRLRIFGADPVSDIVFSDCDLPPKKTPEAKGLKQAFAAFGKLSGGRLVTLTHQTGGAWAKYYQSGKPGAIITRKDILQEYHNVFDDAGAN